MPLLSNSQHFSFFLCHKRYKLCFFLSQAVCILAWEGFRLSFNSLIDCFWALPLRFSPLGDVWRMLSRIAVLVGLSFAIVLQGHGVSAAQSPDTSSPPPGHFVDVTEKLGIHFRQQASATSKKYLLETMGSGVALFDYDNDGRLDVFFANGARLDDPTLKGSIPRKDGPKYWNRLYHQKPDGTFEDVTEHAGLTGYGLSLIHI